MSYAAAAASSSASGDGGRGSHTRVKFICNLGGQVLPRPSDGSLRYVGGETHLVTVPRSVTLSDLLSRLTSVFGTCPSSVKYQLPGEGLDSLISVSSPDDVENMLEEYDKLPPNSNLRLFLFSSSPNFIPNYTDFELDATNSALRYVEAINGYQQPLPRKDSFASITSSVAAHSGGNLSPAPLSPSSSDDLPKSMIVNPPPLVDLEPSPPHPHVYPVNNAAYQSVGIPQLSLHQPYVAVLPGAVNQSFVQVVGNETTNVGPNENGELLTAAPPFQFEVTGLPAVHHFASVVPNSSNTELSQVGGNTGAAMDAKAESIKSHENANEGRVPYRQPLSQLPPLPRAILNAQKSEMHGVHSTAAPLPWPAFPGNVVRFEDCSFCQNALPHAHSDPAFDALTYVPSGFVAVTGSPVYHSLRPEDFVRLSAPQKVDVGRGNQGETLAAPPSASVTVSSPAEGCSVNKNSVVPDNKERVSTKAEYILSMQTDMSGSNCGVIDRNVPLDGEQPPPPPLLTNSGLSRDQVISVEEEILRPPIPTNFGLPLHPVNHEKPFKGNESPTSNTMFKCREHFQQTDASVMSQTYASLVDRAPDMLRLNQATLSGSTMVHKSMQSDTNALPHLNYEPPLQTLQNSSVVGDISGKEMNQNMPFFDISERTTGFTNQANPSAATNVPSMQILQLGNKSGMPNTAGSSSQSQSNLEKGVGVLGVPASSDLVDLTHASNSIRPSNNQKLHATEVVPLPVNVQPSSETKISQNTNLEQLQHPSDVQFRNEGPWDMLKGTHALPPKPKKIATRDSITITHKDAPSDNHATSSKESSMTDHLVGDNSKKPQIIALKEPSADKTAQVEDEIGKRVFSNAGEGLAAPTLLTSQSKYPVFYDETGSIVLINDGTETINRKIVGEERGNEVIRSRPGDWMGTGFPNADFPHLQIIQNCDLEELRELGSGTFGTVYHGKWKGSDVAIKRINDRCFAGKPSEQERIRADFWNEASKLADLHHPNVVAFYGVVLDGPGGSIATVTEFMVNGSLRQALQKNDKLLDRRKRLILAMDAAFGMEYLHSKNIVHFDLKSDNLLVNLRDPHRPICKVGDLGLSKVKCHTLISGGVRGTLPWMAPELLNGGSSLVSEKVDVFSFGIVLWELLTGEEPYADLHYGVIIGGIVSNTLRPEVPESCDPQWKSLMVQCWSSEPTERPSFTEIASRLRSMAASLQKGQS